MSRIWKQQKDTACLSKEDQLRARLDPHFEKAWEYCIQVCGFTFVFNRVSDIQEYVEFFSRKTHPSSRTPAIAPPGYSLGSHWERQTKFDELPLYLQAEGKRQQVVKALTEAQIIFQRQDAGTRKGGSG